MNIKVYTMPGCGPCKMVKLFLEKLEIPYQELPLEENEYGYRSAPVTTYSYPINDLFTEEIVIMGFNTKEFHRLKDLYNGTI